MDKISVVIPVYNEEQGLSQLFTRLVPVMDDMQRDYEIVLVDDGSKDGSLAILRQHASDKIHIVELTRNYGQHAAVFAGFEASTGEIIVTMDADLQNPPEEIPRLVQTMEDGPYEVVGTVRRGRIDSLFRTVPSKIVNAMARKITGVQLNDWGCMLRAYRREVVENMVKSQEHSTFIPALATTFAKDITEIEVAHEERFAGESKYSLAKLISLQFDLVTSFSDFPLKLMLYTGLVLAFLGIAFGVVLGVARLYFGAAWAAQGVFTLFAVLFFFIGAQFLAFGVMGEYVGRIYREVKKRPPYSIRRIHGDRTPADDRIDWNAPARETYKLIQGGIRPYTRAYGFLGPCKILFWSATVREDVVAQPGGITIQNDTILIGTGHGCLQPLKIEVDGRIMHEMDLFKYLKAHKGACVQ